MKSLQPIEKELVVDHFLGMTSDQERVAAQKLVESHAGAAEFLGKLKAGLEPLNTLEIEACPERLAEKTIHRLMLAAKTQQRLEELLKSEAAKPVTTRQSFWSNFSELGAVAAMILIVAGVGFPTLNVARNQYWQTKCGSQLSSVARGISQYSTDNKQALPTVAMAAGSPWWKVGDQGQENVSNTRHLWLLVKGNYAEPEYFVCPARIQGKAVKLDRTQVARLSDFPSRKYVTYSFRIFSNQSPCDVVRGNKILISDMNPVFENLPEPTLAELNLKMSEAMMKSNSMNHRGKGQSVLCGDNSVRFEKKRNIGMSQDDIYTLKNQNVYKGSEVPCSSEDDFLAP